MFRARLLVSSAAAAFNAARRMLMPVRRLAHHVVEFAADLLALVLLRRQNLSRQLAQLLLQHG